MEIQQESHYCEHCQKETLHQVEETAFEIEYTCENCGETDLFYKTFF